MAELSEILAQTSDDTQSGRYLIFTVGKEHFGIGIKYVTEIIGIQPITLVPGLPKYIKGIINLRGQIIPVVDVRLRFGLETMEYGERTCIIIADIDGLEIGFIVESVLEVQRIPHENIVEPPEINKRSNRFITGIGKVGDDIRLLLDYKSLIGANDAEIIIDKTKDLSK